MFLASTILSLFSLSPFPRKKNALFSAKIAAMGAALLLSSARTRPLRIAFCHPDLGLGGEKLEKREETKG